MNRDNAVGLQISHDVSAWKIPSIRSIATDQLMPDLVNDIASVDYAFFVGPDHSSSCVKTLQLAPIVAGCQLPRTEQSAPMRSHVEEDPQPCTPMMLLNLAQQLYGQSPQAWLLQVPTAPTDCPQNLLASTTQRVRDHALRTIEQFFVTYRQPARGV